ncbi:MAG TPA: hypothetical protein VMN76_06760 [Acidobacteriota bacterium]|nr:hypothetical protein [Acidobacteriota bacterium]
MRKLHQGIRIDKIPANGIGGLIFAIGIAAIALIGIPASRPFLAVALPAGALVAVLRYLWLKRTR